LCLYSQIDREDLEITSNKVFYDPKNEIIYLETDVSIISEDLNIKSNSAKIFLKSEIIEFSGEPASIEIFFPEQIKGSAENIVFNPTRNIKLLGNAILLTDELNLNSDEITYSLSAK
tara:strand:- start:294 stop:644 length:351 start_codon:yes stop_codon:yes gene_type:complete